MGILSMVVEYNGVNGFVEWVVSIDGIDQLMSID